jgi:hypothetical protein
MFLIASNMEASRMAACLMISAKPSFHSRFGSESSVWPTAVLRADHGTISVGEQTETVEDVYEPYLIQQGFLGRTPRGRVATRRAHEHLGRPFRGGGAAGGGDQGALFG